MSARPHAFVAMPFGIKPAPKDPDGKGPEPNVQMIDFNRVYNEYIQPALEQAGLEPFRADKEIPMVASAWTSPAVLNTS